MLQMLSFKWIANDFQRVSDGVQVFVCGNLKTDLLIDYIYPTSISPFYQSKGCLKS
jgi:hypothetical protein